MSNKTQLQTNNTALASLIQTLQGKAAGGGGSGGTETCELTINFTGSLVGYGEAGGLAKVRYSKVVSGSIELGDEDITSDSTTFDNVLKGSMLFLTAYDDLEALGTYHDTTENIVKVWSTGNTTASSYRSVLFISENGTVTFS